MTAAATGHEPEPVEPDRLTRRLTVVREPYEPEPDHEPDDEPGEPDPDREPEAAEPERLPAFAMPSLRPYADPKAVVAVARQGIKASRKPVASLARRALAAVARGSGILIRLSGTWLVGRWGRGGSILARFAIAAFLVYSVARTVALAPVSGLASITCLWLAAAEFASRGHLDALVKKAVGKPKKDTEKKPKDGTADKPTTAASETTAKAASHPADETTAKAAGHPADEPTVEAADHPAAEAPAEPPLTALIRSLIGTDNGVHLSTLRPAMRQHLPGLQKAADKELRQVLTEAGWDPSRTFRAGGVAGRSGISRDQLPPLPSPKGEPMEPPTELSAEPSTPADQAKPPRLFGSLRGARREKKGHPKAPEGWTAEEVARGFRCVDDPDRGPSATRIERLEDVR